MDDMVHRAAVSRTADCGTHSRVVCRGGFQHLPLHVTARHALPLQVLSPLVHSVQTLVLCGERDRTLRTMGRSARGVLCRQHITTVRNMLRCRIMRKGRRKVSDKMWSTGKSNYQVICGLLRLALRSLQAV